MNKIKLEKAINEYLTSLKTKVIDEPAGLEEREEAEEESGETSFFHTFLYHYFRMPLLSHLLSYFPY